MRQFLSVVLSIIFFAHPLNTMEAVGIAIVFLALGSQIADKWRQKRIRPKKGPQPPTPPNADAEMQSSSESTDNPKASLLRTSDRTVSSQRD